MFDNAAAEKSRNDYKTDLCTVQHTSNLYVVCALPKFGLSVPWEIYGFFYIFCGGLECVGHSFAFVAPL